MIVIPFESLTQRLIMNACYTVGSGCGISSDCCGDLTCGYFAVDGVLDWTQKVCGPK